MVVRTLHAAEETGAAQTAAAAMTLVGHTDALIIDLRQCGDGAASMVVLLASFLLDGQVHLVTIRGRPDRPPVQHWTPVCHCGPRYRAPVFVLTGERTGGAGALLAWALRARGRVRIVGTPLAGPAPLVLVAPVDPRFEVAIPVGHEVGPSTGDYWSRLEPDIPAAAEDALAAARAAARRRSHPNGH
jgi:C-terminal processing protease CtpA/Prc